MQNWNVLEPWLEREKTGEAHEERLVAKVSKAVTTAKCTYRITVKKYETFRAY